MSADEISTLSSIYFGSENLKPLYSPIGKKYSITLSVFNVEILLEILVPVQYPLDINPIFTILKPETSNQFKEECKRELYSIWDHTREECLYSSIEWYFLSFFCYNNASLRGKFEEMYKEMGLKEKEVKEEKCHVDVTSKEVESGIQIPNVVHSNAVVVKKSKFIAHFARVKNHEEVAVVLHAIKSNKNYCDATHPCICAFILSNPLNEDYEDDGEGGAGSKLLFLLQLSRWYGGVNLGSDRFKCITNVAKTLLEEHEL